MKNRNKTTKQQIQDIKCKADRNSKLYGKLLRWKQSREEPWSYGIGLCDTYLFDTGEAFEVTDKYQEEIIRIITDHDTAKFSSNDVIERLIECMVAFNDDEHEYDQIHWNDEHFARFVATNKAISFNNKEKKENLRIKKALQNKEL